MQGISDNLGLTSRGQRIDNTVDVVYGRSPLLDGDLLTWEQGTWTTEPPLFNVPGRAPNTFLVSDNNNNLLFETFNHSAEFTGNAVSTPLDLTDTGVLAGAYTIPLITVSAKGRITTAASGQLDIGLRGTGDPANLLRTLARFTTWMQTQTIAGNTTATVLADTLVVNVAFANDDYGSGTAALQIGTGIWTCQKTGLYDFQMTVIGPDSNQSGVTTAIEVTTPFLTNFPIARGDLPSDSGTSGAVDSVSCGRAYPMTVNTDSMRFRVGSFAGGARTYTIGVSVTFLGELS